MTGLELETVIMADLFLLDLRRQGIEPPLQFFREDSCRFSEAAAPQGMGRGAVSHGRAGTKP